ncbi:MAG TPA: pyridoxamine 5'-phosphate oxidase family protein [Candidatus Limnocylindrales bacterium]|nr:pyridoxamine 5'-phosphate oxidase family protein [Candidatus Limnocylindrales bacterium]
MPFDSPFHEGELEVQKRAGEEAAAEANGAMIIDHLYPGALNFIRQQQMAVLSSRDAGGHRWASVVFGVKGFLEPGGLQTLQITVPAAERDACDPVWRNLQTKPQLGVLIIELANRRRLRINGEARFTEKAILLDVKQSFPNCPKYITKRELKVELIEMPEGKCDLLEGTVLPARLHKMIGAADVLFLATGNVGSGNDASHRGGSPGFLEVTDKSTVRLPDYPGNGLFNTLGNVIGDPEVGLLIPDFEHGRQLQLTARAKILWDQPDPGGKTGGTNRFVEFAITRWLERPLPARLKSSVVSYSPYNPGS